MAFLEREEHRAQLRVAGAFLLGAALIAMPIYFWHRSKNPRAVEALTSDVDAGPIVDAGIVDAAVVDAGPPSETVVVGVPRVLECHDEGSKKTEPSDCDHPATIEAALAAAISSTAVCAKGETGTIAYELDVSFLRKRNPLEITAPHDERTVKNAKTARACAVDVKRAMLGAIDPDGGIPRNVMASAPHAHGRYKLLVTATYAAP
ncbi:MAG: hypothetical protein ABI183_24840 [Polyangiaceae bacterium]